MSLERMELACSVVISNRELSTLNLSGNKKPSRARLSIGRKTGKAEGPICVQLCTAQNKAGFFYEVQKNLKVFDKFLAEGKFTLRFGKPSHDLIVKADSTKARQYLMCLVKVMKNGSMLDLPSLKPLKSSEIPTSKKKLTIATKNQYPITEGFPTELESLEVTNLQLTRIEKRIIQLKHLKKVNLQQNSLKSLPIQLRTMMNLVELTLRDNRITDIPSEVFSGNLAGTLALLDLSHNKLTSIPCSLTNLKKLAHLDLSYNNISWLPFYIGQLSNLMHLQIGNNAIQQLPSSYSRLCLQYLGVSDLPFSVTNKQYDRQQRVPALKELCGRFCVSQGIRYDASQIPATLCEYLDRYLLCRCFKKTFNSHIIAETYVDAHKIAPTISGGRYVAVLEAFCSKRCLLRYR